MNQEIHFIESNYIPVSILSNISKIYERCLYTQIASFFEDKLSRYQCGFRKGTTMSNSDDRKLA